MKKIILFFVVGIMLIGFVCAENCKVAWPQFGVVSCEVFFGSNPETETKSFSCSNNYCSVSFSCVGRSNCQINNLKTDISLNCPDGILWSYYYHLNIDGSKRMPSSTDREYGNCWWGCEDIPNSGTGNFKYMTIEGNCETKLGAKSSFTASSIAMSFQNIYLYDTNPDRAKYKIESSAGCIPQGIMYKSGYTTQLPSSWVDSSGSYAEKTKPNDLIDSLPTNMNPGETYSYLYGWREVSGINVVSGKNGNLVGYCGGGLGERKLLSYTQVSGNDGCYIIPTSVQKNVECCYNEDCKWKDASGKYVCDPTTFTCSLERPCNSDYECQVIGEETCQNKVQSSWKCDLSLPWQPYKGTCKQSTKNVLCCTDNDCSSEDYCDKELGCKPRYVLQDCPYGKCCNSGGDYKPNSCSGGLECCTNGGYVGDCKESCIEIEKTAYSEQSNQKNSNGITGAATGISNGFNYALAILILLAILLISGLFAWAFYSKNKKSEYPKDSPKEEIKSTSNTKEATGRHCTNCGNPLKPKDHFCTNCGKRPSKK